jgi:hypothetical protein
MTTTLRELRETFAETLIGQLDTGYVLWHDGRLPPSMPRSLASGKNFNGVNALILMSAESAKGYDDHRWAAYKESLYIRRGEKGVFVEWWNKKGENEIEFRPVLCFNARQLFHYPAAEENGFGSHAAAARRVLNRFGIPFPSPVLRGTAPDFDKTGNNYFDEYDANENDYFIFRRKDWRDALKTAAENLTGAEGVPWNPDAFKKPLSALRLDLSVSFLTLSLGMGVPEPEESLPLTMWASAIRENPSEIARAAHDAQKLANKILAI